MSLNDPSSKARCLTGCKSACAEKLQLKSLRKRVNTDFTVSIQIAPIVVGVIVLVIAFSLLRKK